MKAHGIVTKTVHKTLPGGGGGKGWGIGGGGVGEWGMVGLGLLSIEWNLIRPGGPAHGIVTKTVHKTLPGVGLGVVGSRGWCGDLSGGGVEGLGVVRVQGVVGSRG